MQITYRCPVCGRDARATALDRGGSGEGRGEVVCGNCGHAIAIPEAAIAGDQISRCLVCPSHELFVRKDFPQRVGLWIVIAGFAASCVAWAMRLVPWTFGILFATAAIDVVLYLLVPDCLQCYRCGARYRGPGITRRHAAFDLETHEKHRQAVARTAALASTARVSTESPAQARLGNPTAG